MKYKANDGTIFEKEEDCLKYEHNLRMKEAAYSHQKEEAFQILTEQVEEQLTLAREELSDNIRYDASVIPASWMDDFKYYEELIWNTLHK